MAESEAHRGCERPSRALSAARQSAMMRIPIIAGEDGGYVAEREIS